MKKVFFLIGLLSTTIGSFAQMGDSNCTGGNFFPPLIDSFYFDSNTPTYGRLVIDTSFPGNIWQIGAVQKTGFNGALSGTNALQTDTLNPYPVNNESAAVLYIDTVSFLNGETFSLTFWHYYDTDTLADSCVLQYTSDSGKTWVNTGSIQGAYFYYSGSLNNYSMNFGWPQTMLWTGKSNGWLKESLCVNYAARKGLALPKSFGFRFLFKSDSVETNKPGWMVDNLLLRQPQLSGISVKDVNKKQGLLYPNPSASGIFRIDYPERHVQGTIEVFNNYGQLVKQEALSGTINLTDLPKGFYHYRIKFSETGQIFTGAIVYE